MALPEVALPEVTYPLVQPLLLEPDEIRRGKIGNLMLWVTE